MHQLLLALAVSTPGLVENETPTAEAVARDAAAPLTFSVTPGAWMVRLRGESSWGGGERTYNDQLGMDDMEPSFRGEFRVGRDDWGIWVMGTTFSTSGSGNFATNGTWAGFNFAAGERYSSSFDMTNVAIEGQWNPVDLIGEPNADIPLFLTFGGHLGGLYTNMKQTFDFGGNATEAKGEYATLYGGLQLLMRMDTMDRVSWLHHIDFNLSGSAGGTLGRDGGTMWQVRADLQFYFTEQIAFLFGYRLLELNVSDDDYEANPSLQGLFVGLTVDF
ncbi:MAG: hypothetical protein VX727_03760 [Planctomycetota bacterium]|nr:hypothetical protein [Planctomycetota bacterium]